jgi:hypothetical protein
MGLIEIMSMIAKGYCWATKSPSLRFVNQRLPGAGVEPTPRSVQPSDTLKK